MAMFRVPFVFAIVNFFVLLAQSDGTIPAGGALTYGALVCMGFTAVWVKLWAMQATIIKDKNATILELKTRVKELEDCERNRIMQTKKVDSLSERIDGYSS